jgi:cysteinyl-tRNA synthetase
VERLKSALRPASASAGGLNPETDLYLASAANSAKTNFTEAMDNDFNTAGAVAALFELTKSINTARDNGATNADLTFAQTVFKQLAGVLGLKLEEKQGSGDADAFINLLIEVRAEVRKQKLWALSDQIRDKLKELNVTIEDSKDGTKWRWG